MCAKCSRISAPSFYWFKGACTTMPALLCHSAFNVFLRHKLTERLLIIPIHSKTFNFNPRKWILTTILKAKKNLCIGFYCNVKGHIGRKTPIT